MIFTQYFGQNKIQYKDFDFRVLSTEHFDIYFYQGCDDLAAFAEVVDYNVQTVAGCRRIFFGGEGLFMTRLTGPGRVLLQTLKRAAQSKASAGAATGG